MNNIIAFGDNNADPNGSNRIYVRYTVGNAQMEIAGDADLIQNFMRPFLTGALVDGDQLEYKNESSLVKSDDSSKVHEQQTQSNPEPKQLKDLLAFYHKLNPQSQTEQVVLITYFYQHELNVEQLSLQDYEDAYKLLQRIPVEMPSNMKSTVRNVVDRTKFLRNSERGKFMLTMVGEELAESMMTR